MQFIKSLIGQLKAGIPFYLAAHLVLAPTAWAEPCDPAADGAAVDLSETIDDAAAKADPCMFMPQGTTPPEYEAMMADAKRQIDHINQPIMYGPGYDVRGYYRKELGRMRKTVAAIATKLESDIAAAQGDCQQLANLQSALADYYMGPARDFQVEYSAQYRDHHSGYDGLNDVYVNMDSHTASLLSGPWLALLDPTALSAGQLRYNPLVEQVSDIQALSKGATEEKYLSALQLRLANAELQNFATLDALLPDGGKAPCIPDSLKRKFPSLQNPERIVDYHRQMQVENHYRQAITPIVQDAMGESTPLATRELGETLADSDPWLAQWLEEKPQALTRLAQLEADGAPQIFAQLLQQERSRLSSMPDDARRRRVAELAELARAGIVIRYLDTVLGVWEKREASSPMPESEKKWTGFNTDERRQKRRELLLDYLRKQGTQLAGKLELPEPAKFVPGAHRSDYVDSVIPVALAAADLEETAGLVKQGLPPTGVDLGAQLMEVDGGLQVLQLNPSGVAANVGMARGDILTHIDGKPVSSLDDVERILENQYGRNVELTVKRDGATHTVQGSLAVHIAPQAAWSLMIEPFMDEYPVLEDQIPDNWFRRNIPGVSLNYQTRYGEDGTKAVQQYAGLINNPQLDLIQMQAQFYQQLSNQENPDIGRQLLAMSQRIGLLDGGRMPTMERVFDDDDTQGKIFLNHMNEKIQSLPLVSQNIVLDDGMIWDTEAKLYELAQKAARDQVDFYRVRNGRLVVNRDALEEYLDEDQVDAAARAMQRVINRYARQGSTSRFLGDLEKRRDSFKRLETARDNELAANNYTPTYYGMGYGAVNVAEVVPSAYDLRQSLASHDMDVVRKRVEDYWHDSTAKESTSPDRLLARAIDYVVSKATQGEKLDDDDMETLRTYLTRARQGFDRSITYSRDSMERTTDALDRLAKLDSINGGLFSSGDPVDPRAKKILRDYARDRRAELDDHFAPTEKLGHNVLDALIERINSPRMKKYDSYNDALMQELNLGDLAELSASLKRNADRVRVGSEVRNAERNVGDVTDRLVARNPELAKMHTEVRGALNDALVQSAIRAAIDDVCETLENLADQDDVEDLRKNLLSSVIRQSILQEFPRFKDIDAASEEAFQDYEEGWQTVTKWGTQILLGAAAVVWVASYFVPGLNAATASATPFVSGTFATLFAAEAASGVYDAYRLNDRASFSESLGTATYSGVMMQDPGVTSALNSESNSALMWAGFDALWVLWEVRNVAKFVKNTRAAAQAARQEVMEAQRLVSEELGIDASKATPEELTKAFRRFAVKNHPDKFAAQGQAAIDAATKHFQEVSKAMDTLRNAAATIPPPPSGGPSGGAPSGGGTGQPLALPAPSGN